MARLAVSFTVIFLLFTLSQAFFITVEPENYVNSEETVSDLPESDPKTTTAILLPTERPGFEPAKTVDFKHEDASETHSDVESDPLTMINFHPVNRHFPRRPLVPFRHKHNCRFYKRFRALNPRFQQKRFISYGNDMILSEKRPRFHPEPRGVVPQIQARWDRFTDDGAESQEHVDFIKLHHHGHDNEHEHDHDHDDDHHHHHRHHHHGEEERDESEEHGHEHEGGFMKRFRNFLTHF